jgi:uncharacterized membrane protein
MLRLSIPYFTFKYDVDFLLTKQKIIHLRVWRYAFYVHVFLSIFALSAGLTQFSNYILKRWKKLHRTIGYLYVIDVLCLAGPSGLVMSFYANGTIWAKTSFILLSLLWMASTFLALRKAQQKDFAAHRKWITRSYSLTLSAITLRLLAMIVPHFFRLDAQDEYTLISWSSWIFNLLIAEVIIYRQRSKPLLI